VLCAVVRCRSRVCLTIYAFIGVALYGWCSRFEQYCTPKSHIPHIFHFTHQLFTPPLHLYLHLYRYSEELKSEMARRLNYFVPQGLRWITQPIFGYIFDKKILNLDTEHLKQVRWLLCSGYGVCD
jgi:hypothetical protein